MSRLQNSYGRDGSRPSSSQNRPFFLFFGGSRSVATVLSSVLQEALKIPARISILAALAGLALCGCALGPKQGVPALSTPVTYRGQAAPAETNSLADLPWWDIYRDKALQDLIRTALASNYDARIAVSRVEQARFVAAQSRALLMPSAGYQYSLSHGRADFLGSPNIALTEVGDSSYASVSANWEVDLWGRLRRQDEAVRAQYLATQEARNGVRMMLVGEVAQDYFSLLALDLELGIARRTTNSFGESLTIFSERLSGGVASKLEVSRAAASLASVSATIPDLQRQTVILENQINILLGREPGPVERPVGLLAQALPPEVPAGLPSDLLERRPDIRQAAQTLRAANAQVGAQLGNFFPKLNLTAAAGSVSDELAAFGSGGENSWGVGGSLSGPIFQGGRLTAQYRQAQAAWDEARLAYEQTVRNAFQEVANALVTREKLAEIRSQEEIAVQALTEAVKLSTERYIAGKASYYEVLEAQQQLFPAENALAQTQLSQWLVTVQLYMTLGGGWEQN